MNISARHEKHRIFAPFKAHDASIDGAGRNDTSEASKTMSSSASANITGEINVRPPKWFAKNVGQVCDRGVGRPRRYREMVRSEMVIPSFSNSPWIRGAPQSNFQRPYAESDRDRLNRCVVFRDGATGGAGFDVRRRDASGWLEQHQRVPPSGPEPAQK
jgi:hypothetical protein